MPRRAGRTGLQSDGTLDVTCHCERTVLAVSVAEVRAGRTRSCGEFGCWKGCVPATSAEPRRRGGRPPGSRNRPKARTTPAP